MTRRVWRNRRGAIGAIAASVSAFLVCPPIEIEARQTSSPLTLEAARQRAREANRSLIAARLQRPVSLAGVGVAAERPNPDLSFEAERETPKQSIGLWLPIELGGKRPRRIALAEAGVAAADAEIARVTAEIDNDVRRAFYTVLAADRRVALVNDTRSLAARVHDTAAIRAQAGDVPELEVVQTQIGLLEADQDLTAARGEASAARTELNVLIGEPPAAPVTLDGALDATPLPVLASLLQLAREASTTLASLDRRIAEQEARRDLAVALKVPDLTAGAALTYLAQPEFAVGWRASAGLTLPLFTRHAAGVAVESAELTRLRADRDANLAAIESAVAAALTRAAAAREQMTRFDTEILPALQRAEQMVQDGYTAGQTPLVAVLTALQQTRESRAKGLQAALDYQLALADLERAVGTRLR
jgi:cobalt-zinc-cadmium efflux system outer membrane protein